MKPASSASSSTVVASTRSAASAISAARAGDLFDLLIAGTTAGGAAALTWMAYNTAFDGRWLLRLPHAPYSLELLGLIFLAFGGFRIVALAYDRSETGGIMHRTREIERCQGRLHSNPDNLAS
ncbi:hypothetical protein [Acidiphilium sp. 34-64-41]|uniref:hypothetical protein n=1 Tax=Acidiphilium sp. 34-64-41 TaxID=1970297 RepID=UPI00257A4F20|nr:hypothetical protein [Acidiphilium sp. 34-64-41]